MLSEWKRRVGSRLYRWRDVCPIMLAVLAVSTAVVGVCLGLRFSENVHVVAPGLVYHSAQLWPEELEFVIADYGIRSIISLVPPEPEQPWYRGEISVAPLTRLFGMRYRSRAGFGRPPVNYGT
jgi:hypothetical protein